MHLGRRFNPHHSTAFDTFLISYVFKRAAFFLCRSGFAYTGLDRVNAHQMVASCITLESLSLAALLGGHISHMFFAVFSSILIFLFNVVLAEEICNASYDGKSDDPPFLGHLHRFPPFCLPVVALGASASSENG
jgi:hypothetical protein